MKYQTYEGTIAKDCSSFDFISIGRKGRIRKRIMFNHTEKGEFASLTLVDLRNDGTFDDTVVTDNGDRDKILATVAKAIRIYTDKYPDKWVVFRGNTDARTRLYRVAITLHFDELSKEFVICGAVLNDNKPHLFSVGVPYVAFLVKKKLNNFTV
jgi:hypothetical protein